MKDGDANVTGGREAGWKMEEINIETIRAESGFMIRN